MQQVPAGWYPDPEYAGHLRYWDGVQWTDHRSARPGAAPHQTAPHQTAPYPTGAQGHFAPQHGGYPAAAQQSPNTLSILGIVFGGIAFLVLPILFGPAGLILGAVGLTKNERLAPVALTVSGAGLVIGMVIGALAVL